MKKKIKKKAKSAKSKRTAGQPTKFKKSYLPKMEKLYAKGATDLEVAKHFKVTRSTIGNWKKNLPEFLATLKKGKDVADDKVKDSLYKRANGFDYKETTSERKINPKTGKAEMVVTKIVTKHMPPELGACVFWLINRKSDDWKKNGKDFDPDSNAPCTIDFKFSVVNDASQG